MLTAQQKTEPPRIGRPAAFKLTVRAVASAQNEVPTEARLRLWIKAGKRLYGVELLAIEEMDDGSLHQLKETRGSA